MAKLSSKIVLAFLFFVATLNLHGATLKIDKGHSHVAFSIKHLMISNVKGEFKDYSGELEFDTKTKQFTKFQAAIEAASIDTGIEKRDNHLRSEDFFDAEKYPKLFFVMNSYESNGDEGIIHGNITIRGVTKPIKLNVEYNGMIKDPWGNTRAGFSINGKINRKDFGLNWNKVLEAGGVVVGDDVKLQIELETFVK